MKKWIPYLAWIVSALFLTGAEASEVQVDPALVKEMVKNPSALEHLQKGLKKLLTVTTDYIQEATILANRYPNIDETLLFKEALKTAQPYLDHPDIILRAFPLLHAGCFDASGYKGDVAKLGELQDMILTTEIKENILWDAYKSGELSVKKFNFHIDFMEEECMEKIKSFCEESVDPFFNQTLATILQNCEDRFEVWDVLLGDFGFYYEYMFDPPWAINYLDPGEKAFYRLDSQYLKLFQEIYDEHFSPAAILKLLQS